MCFDVIPRLDDEHWVIDTDYENYAIHYSCREVAADGTCRDSYSFVFSRHHDGLRPQDQQIVTAKKNEICLLGKYRRVPHNGEWRPARRSSVCLMISWSVPFVSQFDERQSEWLMELRANPRDFSSNLIDWWDYSGISTGAKSNVLSSLSPCRLLRQQRELLQAVTPLCVKPPPLGPCAPLLVIDSLPPELLMSSPEEESHSSPGTSSKMTN